MQTIDPVFAAWFNALWPYLGTAVLLVGAYLLVITVRDIFTMED